MEPTKTIRAEVALPRDMEGMVQEIATRAAEEAVNNFARSSKMVRTRREKIVSRRKRALAWFMAMAVGIAEAATLAARLSAAQHLWTSFGIMLLAIACFGIWWAVDDETQD